MHDRPFIIGYLAALWDGEGTVYAKFHETGRVQLRSARVSMQDIGCIEFAALALKLLGIAFRRYTTPITEKRKKPMYIISIQRAEALKKFQELIPLQHREKAMKLRGLISSRAPGTRCGICGVTREETTRGCTACARRKSNKGKGRFGTVDA